VLEGIFPTPFQLLPDFLDLFRRFAVVVRVNCSSSSRALRLERYLSRLISSLIPKKGITAEFRCDVRMQDFANSEKGGERVHSCSLNFHGNKRFQRNVTGKGNTFGNAIRDALRKLEVALDREHDKTITRRRSIHKTFVEMAI
jgi:hypothetical protein